MIALLMTIVFIAIVFIVSVYLFLIYQYLRFLRERERCVLASKKQKTISRSITKAAIKYHEDELFKRVPLDDEQFFLKYRSPVALLFWRMHFAEALSSARKSGNALALDVGGSDGYLSMYAGKIGLKSICLDICDPRLEKAREKFRNKGMYFVGVVADATCLPFKEESFSSVYCLDVLEHIPSGEDCIKEAYRVLSKEGNVVATTPCATSMTIVNLFEFMYKLRAVVARDSLQTERMFCSDHGILRYKSGVTVKEAPYFFHRDFTPYELEKEFRDTGFRIATVHTYYNLLVDLIANMIYKTTHSLGPTRGTIISLEHLISILPYLKYLGRKAMIVGTKP